MFVRPVHSPTKLSASGRAWAVISTSVLAVALGGCSSLWPGRSDDGDEEQRLKELLTVPKPPSLIGDAASPFGLRPLHVEGVAAVNGLEGTGGPPDPSPQRDQLIEEMKRENVRDPNLFLESPATAMVRVQAIIPPGAKRGDVIDLLVTAPSRSRATDLQGGWLLNTRLRHQRKIQNAVRKSDVKVIGVGSVLPRAAHEAGDNPSHKLEGRVLSGGVVQVEQPLALLLRPEYKHAKLAAELAAIINRRFFFFDGSTRRGVAKAIEDDLIEIDVHPQYRANVHRMLDVVRALSGRPQQLNPQIRLSELATRLAAPATAADAALQLEAIGEDAIPTLLTGLESDNRELRFYAAEALGYLNREEAIESLEQAARETAAFRHAALRALQVVESELAVDALVRLLHEPSLETRYGAFCAIRSRADGKLRLTGHAVGDAVRVYSVPSSARPAVVGSLRDVPEVVLFGSVSPLQIVDFLHGPSGILIKPDPRKPGTLRVSRFVPGKEDRRAVVGETVEDLAQGIVAVGGSYGDILATLRIAKSQGQLIDQLAFDPLPESVSTYYRDDSEDQTADTDE